ncbi:hypothetical protein, partial [Bradyrhizobium diazoefficiens]
RADIHDGPEKMLQSKAGYIDARPHHLIDEPLATHGRTIHSGHKPPITLKVADFRFALVSRLYEYMP